MALLTAPLDLVNELCRITLDERLGEAPPCDEGAKVGRVLDVGTGTGIWAINFGDEHPEAEILGIDLSPTQPRDVPPNVRFEIDDIEDEWLFNHPFDYIHSRFMTTSISDWPLYLRRCYDNLAPGGWLEIQDPDIYPHSDDGTLKPGNNLTKWADLLMDASKKLGAAYIHPPDLKALLIEAGFEDVRTITHKWPTNSWPKDPKYKEIGIWNHENFLIGLESLSMAPFTRALEWTPEEVRVFLIDVRKDGKDHGIHAYWPM
ncbi:methyltransferase domain-containing protein [Colletotrichum plurivorum]|uniref:Methyltransferase domain-containing protein n=1 Tax=Colletotrichum plurivorum TaxID=2175906 RepID=A0A8H6KE63_9PEZI|nr:methyltransferase domain-containing protein [Colletotrichum plurivorum]